MNKNNSEVKLMGGKDGISTVTYNSSLQSRKHEEEVKNIMTRRSISRKQPKFRYQIFFNGYCYCCSDFSHNAVNCVFNFRNIQRRMFSDNQMMQHKLK